MPFLEFCEIGENTKIGPMAVIGAEPQDLGYKMEPTSVVIGKNCQFAHNALGVDIHPEALIGDNSKIVQNVTIGGRSGLTELPVIEDDVVIGANALILGPITIGKGSIIGAGSVVLKDVPPYSVVVGNPGKVIKQIR